MSRGLGEVSVVQNLVPEWSAPLWALVTQLGDLWFAVVLFILLYWGDRERREAIVSVAIAVVLGVGAFVSLKYTFRLPRPDSPLLAAEFVPEMVRPVYTATAFADGYGFPSGHATVSTIVYFGLASILTIWNRRRRFLTAAVIVGVVSFTRVVLGLHYLVDVIAGTALGATVLVTTLTVAEKRSLFD